jgi:hypothetical protein
MCLLRASSGPSDKISLIKRRKGIGKALDKIAGRAGATDDLIRSIPHTERSKKTIILFWFAYHNLDVFSGTRENPLVPSVIIWVFSVGMQTNPFYLFSWEKFSYLLFTVNEWN